MSLKHLALAVVALAAIAGAAWWLSQPKSAVPTATAGAIGKNPIPAAIAAQTTVVELYSKDADAPAVVLSKAEGDDKWVVASRQEVPVDFQKLASLFKNIMQWEVSRTFPITEQNRERLELSTLRLVLKDESGNVLRAINVGKASITGGSFAIVESQPETALEIKSGVQLDTVESNWIERKVATINASDVKAFTIRFANDGGSTTFSRETADSEWTTTDLPDDKILNPGAVNRFVAGVVETRSIEESPDLEDAAIVRAQAVAHECEFITFSGERYTINVGQDPGLPQPESADAPAMGTEETPAWAEGIVEPQPEAPPASPAEETPRYVYATYTIEDAKNPWAAKANGYAFRVSEHTYKQIPSSVDGFFLDKPTAPAQEPSMEEASE